MKIDESIINEAELEKLKFAADCICNEENGKENKNLWLSYMRGVVDMAEAMKEVLKA